MFKNTEILIESAEAYHGRNQLSTSMVKDWIKGPEVFHWYHVLGNRKEATDAMDFGTAVHEDQLLPIWQHRYEIIPKEVLTSNGARRGKAWEAYRDANAGKVLLKEDAVEDIRRIRAAIAGHPVAAAVLADMDKAVTEVSMVGELQLIHRNETVPYRGRVDILFADAIYDFKTVAEMEERRMDYIPFDMGWDLQAAAYQGLVYGATQRLLPVRFIVMEKKAPFRVEIFAPRQATIDTAFDRLLVSVADIQAARESGFWHRAAWPDEIKF